MAIAMDKPMYQNATMMEGTAVKEVTRSAIIAVPTVSATWTM